MLSLLQLPLDVLELLSQMLSEKDISRCCAVSRSWRETFTQDLFWKKRCAKNLLCLKTTKCQVRPCFNQKTILPPVSEWRLQFMREQHLWSNWGAGQFVEECVANNFTDTMRCKLDFYRDDTILYYRSEKILDVWEVTKKPIRFKTDNVLDKYHMGAVKIYDDVVVTNICNIVVVFNIDMKAKRVPFSRAFIFDQPEGLPPRITEPKDIETMYNDPSIRYIHRDPYRGAMPPIGPHKMFLNIHGDLLLGSVFYPGGENQTPVLHVWNYKTGQKLKELEFPLRNIDLKAFTFLSTPADCRYVPIAVEVNDFCSVEMKRQNFDWPNYTSHTYIFDVTQLDFLPSPIKTGFAPKLYHDNQIWCLHGSLLSCFNLTQTPVVNLDIEPEVTVNHYRPVIGQYPFLALNGSVIVPEAKKLLIINKASSTLDVLLEVDFFIRKADVLNGKFIILYGDICQVYELRGNNLIKCFDIGRGETYTINKTCTKLTIINHTSLNTLTFW